jgi:hypothetical protein
MNERQAYEQMADRRSYSQRIHFDYKACGCALGLTQCNCCGVDPKDSNQDPTRPAPVSAARKLTAAGWMVVCCLCFWAAVALAVF